MGDDGHRLQFAGMSLRAYFATHCPDSWISGMKPETVGEMRNALVARGLISNDAASGDIMRSYGRADVARLVIALRWDDQGSKVMTHQGGGHYVCDTCPDDIATGEDDFEDRKAALLKAGWRTYKGPDQAWAHSCPACVEDFAKRKRS